MSTTGSGTGTPIGSVIPVGGVYDPYEDVGAYNDCAVPLHRYAQLIGYDEPMFFGVRYDGQEERACNSYWDESKRMMIANALSEAQGDIERIIGYPLCPTWVIGEWTEGEQTGRWTDSQPYRSSMITRYPMVIAPGVRGEAAIQTGAVVSYATEPTVIGPIATTVTDTREVQVFYPGTQRRVRPSQVSISGGFVTIYVPRSRLVVQSLLSSTGIEFTDTSNFLTTVDVTRIYNDPSVNAVLVAPHACSSECAANGCSLYTQDACMVFANSRLGFLKVQPATYGNGAWTVGGATVCNRPYSTARLNYYCGMQVLSRDAEMAIVRLAHNKIGESLCSCDTFTTMWRVDRTEPRGTPTRTMQNNPFGISAGARYAFNVALRLKIFRGASTHQ